MHNQGEILLIPVPFTDLSSKKVLDPLEKEEPGLLLSIFLIILS